MKLLEIEGGGYVPQCPTASDATGADSSESKRYWKLELF